MHGSKTHKTRSEEKENLGIAVNPQKTRTGGYSLQYVAAKMLTRETLFSPSRLQNPRLQQEFHVDVRKFGKTR
jgi:hypothetical protein